MSYIVRSKANAQRYVPMVRVSFHTETACYQATGEFVDIGGELDPTNQVLSVTTQKTLDNPAGAFTLELAGVSWLDKIKAQDIVVISMGYKDTKDKVEVQKLSTVMVGLVDRVRSFRSVSGGTPQVNTTITGRDFGKVLIKSQLKFYREIGANNAAEKKNAEKFFLTDEGWITLMSFFQAESIVKGTPAKVLDNIMREILQKLNDVSWTVWDESAAKPTAKKVKIGNVLRYNFAKVDLMLPMVLTADQFEGALWNLMERCNIKPFTELFVDVREDSEAWNAAGVFRVVNETIEESSSEDKASIGGGDTQKGAYPSPRFSFGDDKSAVMVVYRNTPFDKVLWNQLVAHGIEAVDVISEDLSTSDDEHYNLFWAGTTINPFGLQNLKDLSPPLMNVEDVKRYGLCPLEVNVEGLSIDETADGDRTLLETLSKVYTAKLKAWFENNHKYQNGTIVVRGKGVYKIGQRAVRKGIEREFYIEGVTQSFSVYSEWTTSLAVTRGMAIGSAPDHTVNLPKTAETAPNKPVSSKTTAEVKASTYTVQRGDSLWSIAGQKAVYGDSTKWTLLWQANKDMLVKRDSRNSTTSGSYLYPGQILQVPKG